jgi:hypothetical protein
MKKRIVTEYVAFDGTVFESEEMCLDIVQNGAVATGNVYAQIQRTGVLWDAY